MDGQDGGFGVDKSMPGMVGGFTLLRLTGLMTMVGITMTKEERLSINKSLIASVKRDDGANCIKQRVCARPFFARRSRVLPAAKQPGSRIRVIPVPVFDRAAAAG